MTIFLKQLFGLIRLLNSETGDRAIAWGMSLGVVLALSPTLSLQAILVFLCIILFRVQAGAAFLTAFFLKLPAIAAAPLLDWVGGGVLEISALQSVWRWLYQAPILPWTRFHYSVVMGGAVVGFLLLVPNYFLFRSLVIRYRLRVRDRLVQTRIWKALRATRFYGLYVKFEHARELAS